MQALKMSWYTENGRLMCHWVDLEEPEQQRDNPKTDSSVDAILPGAELVFGRAA
jgi:hypothetical protein